MRLSGLFKTTSILASMVLVSSLAAAGERVHEQMKIKVKTDGGATEVVNIENLEVGESREILTESGKSVLVLREEDRLTLDIDGKLIDVDTSMLGGQHHKRMKFLHEDGAVHGQHKVMVFEDVEETIDGQERIVIKRKHVIGDDEEMDIEALISDFDLDSAEGDNVIIISKEIEVHEDGEL